MTMGLSKNNLDKFQVTVTFFNEAMRSPRIEFLILK
jgi:hypothetical protein